MPSWNLDLIGPGGKQLDNYCEHVTSLTHSTIYIEGNPDRATTWKFTKYHDETQVKRDWISQLIFVSGALEFSSDLPDTCITTSSPLHELVSRIPLPYSTNDRHHYILLRQGDNVVYENRDAHVKINFDPALQDPNVQVESSGPGAAFHKIKREIKNEVDTDEETDDQEILPTNNIHRGTSAEESQHLFSTSRENFSPTPRPATRESQVVKDTPNRRKIKSQHESFVPESLPVDKSHSERREIAPGAHAEIDTNDGPTDVLPDIHTSELPNTSPAEMHFFQIPTEPTRSPADELASFSQSQVRQLVENLNEGNPPSQVPADDIAPPTSLKSAVAPNRLQTDSCTKEPAENSPQPETMPAALEPEKVVTEDLVHPAEPTEPVVVDEVVKMGGTADDDIDSTTPAPAIPDTKQKTPAAISKRKRKVTDSVSVTASAKRAKFVDEDTSSANLTPTSTASKRSSGRTRGLETPSGSAPTRASSRRKSLDDEQAPSTISRRVSDRHRSVESEVAPSGSPSADGHAYNGDPPCIIFSNTRVNERQALLKFIKSQGVSQTNDLKNANFLCVGTGELLKTPKLLHSLTLGKTIVTDDWVTQSAKAGFLLDPAEFLPHDLKATITSDRTKIFTDQIIYVTPVQRLAYKRSWDDVMAIIRQAGGTSPLTGPLAKLPDMKQITLYIGAEQDDDVAAELQEMGEKVYKKDLLGASILHGKLLRDETLELSAVEVGSIKAESKVAKAESKVVKKGGRKKK